MAFDPESTYFAADKPQPTKSSQGWFYTLIFFSALLSATFLYALNWITGSDSNSNDGLIELTDVFRLQGTPQAELPTPADGWSPVSLPNDWLIEGYTQPQEWYRHALRFEVPPDRLWEVMLSAVNLNAAVYVNGRLLGVNGRLEEPISHNWNQPLRFAIPNGLLKPGNNELLIRVVSFPPGHGLLGRVYLGPRDDVVAAASELHFVNVEVSRFITGLSFSLCIISFGLWFIRRQDAEYFWFGLLTLLWSIHSVKFHMTEIPISSQFWAWLLTATSISLSYPLYFFLMRIRNQRERMLEDCLGIIWLASLIATTTTLLTSDVRMYRIAEVAYAISFCVSLSAFIRLTVYCARTRSIEALWIAVTISALVVFVIHDVLQVFGFFERSTGQLVIYAMPLLLASFGLVILHRFAMAIKDREEIVATLEQRVTDATNTIVTLERDRALADQRESIMRDMHDGVGGQLVSSLALIKSGSTADPEQQQALEDVLQGALIDLRLMIDSLDTDVDDLNLLLGALRDRMEPVLRAAGFELIWDNTEIPRMVQMSPHKALQVLRILQEALTNAIRHSKASTIRVAVEHRVSESSVHISVEDNGQSFDPATTKAGRGLSNMRRRALDIGAMLDISESEFSSRGTRVCVQLPML